MSSARRAPVRSRIARDLVAARARLGAARRALRECSNVVGIGVGLRERGAQHWPEACFVVEVSSKSEQVERPLPRDFEGVPIDVQPRGKLELCRGPASPIERIESTERGRSGVLVKNPDGRRFALTVMHVLGPDRLGAVVEKDAFRVRMGSGPSAVEGSILYGVLDRSRDIACVEFPPEAKLTSDVAGTGFHYDEPSELGSQQVGTAVGIVISNTEVYEGRLVAYPLDGTDTTFVTDLGAEVAFHNLAKFKFKLRSGEPLEIQRGWSGSVIYRSDTFSPIALLSFRDATQVGAYGFPLLPVMRAGQLAIWRE